MLNLPTSRLTVEVHSTTIVAHGEIDAVTSRELNETLLTLVDRGNAALDVAGVDFMDSSGLRVIIDAHVKAKQAGHVFELVNPGPRIRRLISVTGLDSAITMVERDLVPDLHADRTHPTDSR